MPMIEPQPTKTLRMPPKGPVCPRCQSRRLEVRSGFCAPNRCQNCRAEWYLFENDAALAHDLERLHGTIQSRVDSMLASFPPWPAHG